MYSTQISIFKSTIDAIALNDYSFGNAIEKDYVAIISSNNHVQSSEETSLFVGISCRYLSFTCPWMESKVCYYYYN